MALSKVLEFSGGLRVPRIPQCKEFTQTQRGHPRCPQDMEHRDSNCAFGRMLRPGGGETLLAAAKLHRSTRPKHRDDQRNKMESVPEEKESLAEKQRERKEKEALTEKK